MWPPPPVEAMTTRSASCLIMPQATKPSVGISERYVIVGTSTTAMPLGLSETNARSLSTRNTVQIGALPVAAPRSRLGPTDQIRLASSTAILTTVLVLMTETSAVAPLGDTLTW